jgi:energy-coupling factor transport system substrate-specific component
MLLPRNMPRAAAIAVYPIVCGLHGFLYGVLYAPVQALVYGLNFKMTCAWILAGIPFDLLHGIGNIIFGCFIYPLSLLLKRLMKKQRNA